MDYHGSSALMKNEIRGGRKQPNRKMQTAVGCRRQRNRSGKEGHASLFCCWFFEYFGGAFRVCSGDGLGGPYSGDVGVLFFILSAWC